MSNIFYKSHRIAIEADTFEVYRGKMLLATGLAPLRFEYDTPSLLDRAKRLVDSDFETETVRLIRTLPPARMLKLEDFAPEAA